MSVHLREVAEGVTIRRTDNTIAKRKMSNNDIHNIATRIPQKFVGSNGQFSLKCQWSEGDEEKCKIVSNLIP